MYQRQQRRRQQQSKSNQQQQHNSSKAATAETAATQNSKTATAIPDRTCAFNPDGLHGERKPDSQDNCPAGFSLNESGKCFFSGKCPPGSTRTGQDESGKCFKTNT